MKTVTIPVAASRRLLSLVALLPLVSAVHAADITWDNGAGTTDWFAADNWSTNIRPVQGFGTAGDGATVNSGSVVFNTSSLNADAAFSGSTYFYKNLHVGASSGQSGQISFNAGNVTFDTGGNYFIGRNGGTGVINVNAGTVTLGAAPVYVGIDAGSNGSINVNGGTLIFGRESLGISAYVGNNSGTGSITVSGGSFLTRTAIQLGTATTGVGTFTVSGSAATQIGIGSQGTLDGGWIQNSGSTLRGLVDNGGVTKILVDDTASTGGNNKNGDVTFAAGSLLDVGFVGTGVAGTWVLMQWEGSLTNNGLGFAPGVNTSIWSFSIDETAKTLSITSAVPEPSAFAALAGLGALGFASLRRRRRAA